MRTTTPFRVLLIIGMMLQAQAGQGGGIVTDCTETGLRAAMTGGGTVTFACDGTITLTNTIAISNDTLLEASGRNVTISGGGAVRLFFVTTNIQFSLDHLTFANGRSTNGAAILNAGGTVYLTNSVFFSNHVAGTTPPPYYNVAGETVTGGAIANQGALQAVDCMFSNNTASGGAAGVAYGGLRGFTGGNGAGGAIWNSGLLSIRRCTFAGNVAVGGAGGQGAGGDPLPWSNPGHPGGPGGDGAGGAVYNCGTAWLVNCTLAGNSSTGGAGGLGGFGYRPSPDYPPPASGPNGSPGAAIGGIKDDSGECYLTNCTIVFNTGAGISTVATNGSKLMNTLLAGNLPDGNGAGTITDLGHNLSSDTTCAFTNLGSLNNTYPLIGPLQDNGGLTFTVALLPGCWAIDAGDTAGAPSTDQRGVARPYGLAADIGAYEYTGTNSGFLNVVAECTEASLRAAMPGGGRVTFACDGTITLVEPIVLTTNTLLDGASHQITIHGNGTGLFQVSANVMFSAANLTLAGGAASAGGGIQNNGGLVNVTNCLFSGNVATRGGAIQNQAGQVFLSNCVFTNNHASGGGGGAVDNSGILTMDLCTFAANSAIGSDGLPGNWYGQAGGPGTDAVGGAIYNSQTLTITRSTFTNNTVIAGNGAAGYVGFHGDLNYNGSAGGAGGMGGKASGGVLYNSGAARIIDSTFAFNLGVGGNGGAGGAGGPAYGSGQGGNGAGGGAGGEGAGALFNEGDIQIVNSTFAFNLGSAGLGGDGGAGGNGNFGGSGGSGATGGSGVGACYDDSQEVSCFITNCTFADNSGTSASGGQGGAAGHGNYAGGTTGVAGSSGLGSGAIKTTSGKLINTILAASVSSGNAAGNLIDLGHNLSSDATCAFTNSGSLNNIDARLGPLANNGGPTLTMALLPGSPAMDGGDDTAAPPEDQRGLPRPIGPAADIGAYEYGSPALLLLAPGATQGFDLVVIGKRGQVCRLMASDTLLDWHPVLTNQFGSNGTFSYHDPACSTCRFYRVLLP